MKETRQRRMRLSYKQLKLLVKFMGENPLMAKGVDYRTAYGKHYHDAKWSELADLMNAQGNGMNKSPREWNKYWKDLKCSIKKKVNATKGNNKKPSLSRIQQIIYNEMCVPRQKDTDGNDETHSYLQIPEMDHDQVDYEVEYLEDSSCDETDFNNILNAESGTAIDGNNLDLKGLKEELNRKNVKLNSSKSNVSPERDCDHLNLKPLSKTMLNYIKTNTKLPNTELNTAVLLEIRNQIEELVALQKDRAKSSQRMAAAHERRAILEERKVRIEERRLKLEEKRLSLEEKRMEVLKRKTS